MKSLRRAHLEADTYQPSLDDSRLVRWSVYALMAFPVIDYSLRRFVPVAGHAWDKVIFAILVISAFSRYIRGKRPPRFSWHVFALLFIIYGLFLVAAGLRTHPIQALEGYQFDVYYLLFTFPLPFLIGPKDVRPLLHFGVVVAVAIGAHAIYQYITKVPIPPHWADTHEHVRTRVFSVIKSPNELGAYMALNIPILAGLALSEKLKSRKVFYFAGVVICFAALLFTFTRGAWMALVLSTLILSIIVDRRLLLFVIAFAIVAFFVPAIHHRILDLTSPIYWHKTIKYGRFARWMTGIHKLSKDPLFGAGLGQYGGAVAAKYGHSVYSDDFYVKILGETGIVGLVLFITMHFALVRSLYQKVRSTVARRQRVLLAGGLTGILAILFHNLTENVFEYAPLVLSYFMYAMLFLILGTQVANSGIAGEKVNKSIVRDRRTDEETSLQNGP
ncbi:O-antigen ligase [Alicyclobacillus sp. SO9]|uniref:O-antigen ligase family protein n=1 Tax=Alicyclobacillus sp. SO9 TaxID=2665646 RepID=UPI0018E7C07E|nr:O-antigen ligase family protein [Alicyclobacillus sp. SO9]QQE78635.1 O-antigen ligase family protein [Alicyclobacillus sp. SO9]